MGRGARIGTRPAVARASAQSQRRRATRAAQIKPERLCQAQLCEVIEMRIVRWTPVPSLQDEVSRLFGDLATRSPLRGDVAPLFAPPVDIHETPEAFVIRIDLPGASPKDVKVSLLGDTLTIRGERKQELDKSNGNARRLERVYGTFERSFTLDSEVRGDNVKATYRDGVLEVQVAKAEQARVRDIEVQAG
jgi:HSP20 family protein